MMNQNKTIFSLILTCFATLYSNPIVAQQSKVDSAIMLFNKSAVSDMLDTASFDTAYYLVINTSLTDSQLEQLDTVASNYKSTKKRYTATDISQAIFESILKTNPAKAINYGKLQIERLEKLNTTETSSYINYYLNDLRFPFRNTNQFEEGFKYYTQKLNEYKIKNDSVCIANCYFVLGGFYRISGIIDLAIYNMKKSCSYLDAVTKKSSWINNIGNVGNLYLLKGDKSECLRYSGIALNESQKAKRGYAVNAFDIARMFLKSNELDSAAYYIKLGKEDTLSKDVENIACYLQYEALYKIQSGDLDQADSLLKRSWQLINENKIAVNAAPGTIAPDYYISLIRIKQNKFEQAIALLQNDIVRLLNNRLDILRDYKLMAELYKKTGKNDKAAETYSTFIALQDSLLADQDKFRSYSFEAEQQMSEKELSIAKLESENKISSLGRNFSIGIAALLLLIVAGIYNRFRTKKKANEVLEKTLIDLKSTQQQLVQQEKLASLGALTAGIAHEIKNPLNFVNNFSELSNELIDEFLATDNDDERREIAADLKSNLSKINQHGKRADSIVRNMLEHSRTGNNEKQIANINNLCDEYLNLSYHGMRASNSDFNCTIEKELAENLPSINCVPQEISRVILNLLNNAFYAVNERRKEKSIANEPYQPLVILKTKLTNSKVQIVVRDNGKGMSEQVKLKLFQPFFTTKPAGQGTGLGLSLSYDIVKSHGGEINVESKDNEFTEFVISLPVA